MKKISAHLNSSTILSDIEVNGFAIASNVISIEYIERQKREWVVKFNKKNVTKKFVRGDLVLGEENFLSHSDIPGWCMYRNFDFLWNEASDKELIEVHLDLHRFRNLLQGLPENLGVEYNPACYGFYISTSLYEAGKGHLSFHADGHSDTPILHYMIPITFKGVDYDEGGLFCINKAGVKCDVDSMVKPGDIIFFDGRIVHGVEKVESYSNGGIGRIAQFAVPTFFRKDSYLSVARRSVIIYLKEMANRLGLLRLY
ncbi:hypothetical protein G6726_01770 [Polynucleobacter paneuropaeus]|nr:hypothetical protein G6726_01770 [Polynucleobacter paneuropaeus]